MKKTDHFQSNIDKLKYFGYAESTISTYSFYVGQFLDQIDCAPSKITTQHLKEYLEGFDFTSKSQQNQIISSLKFFFEKVLEKKHKFPNLSRPRKEKQLPKIIDQELIISKIHQVTNLKHKAIIALAYSDSLRISEVINLKIEDVDSKRMIIHIRKSKGNKDRIVKLTKNLLDILRAYVREYRPKVYLFNGQSKLNYSATSCRNIVKRNISKSMRFHDLRHASATHCIENGDDIYKLKDHLGHKSIKTTEIYLHLSMKSRQSMHLPI